MTIRLICASTLRSRQTPSAEDPGLCTDIREPLVLHAVVANPAVDPSPEPRIPAERLAVREVAVVVRITHEQVAFLLQGVDDSPFSAVALQRAAVPLGFKLDQPWPSARVSPAVPNARPEKLRAMPLCIGHQNLVPNGNQVPHQLAVGPNVRVVDPQTRHHSVRLGQLCATIGQHRVFLIGSRHVL